MSLACAVADDGVSAFVGARGRLVGIACRVLGSSVDAEDVVQDAWLRWQRTDRSVVRSAPAFLAATTIRLAINVTRSGRVRHETSEHAWSFTAAGGDPSEAAERSQCLEDAIGLLLAKLTPAERAAYVLGEAFGYRSPRIAAVLGTSEVNARQLASRARRRLAGDSSRPVDVEERRRLRDVFVAAARTGALADLEAHLSADLRR